jgi:hypothetical protein
MGISPAAMQASASVFNVESVAKPPLKARDDVVAPVDTGNDDTSQTGFSSLMMRNSHIGKNVDLKA